jgi:hypothetical protein
VNKRRVLFIFRPRVRLGAGRGSAQLAEGFHLGMQGLNPRALVFRQVSFDVAGRGRGGTDAAPRRKVRFLIGRAAHTRLLL